MALADPGTIHLLLELLKQQGCHHIVARLHSNRIYSMVCTYVCDF